MSTRNRYSPLAPQNEVLPLLPPPEDHQVIEFEERPVTPVEELRIRSLDATPSPTQKEQGSIHEVSIESLVFDSSANHRLLYTSWIISLYPSMNYSNTSRPSLLMMTKNSPTKYLQLGAFVSKYVKFHSNHVDMYFGQSFLTLLVSRYGSPVTLTSLNALHRILSTEMHGRLSGRRWRSTTMRCVKHGMAS